MSFTIAVLQFGPHRKNIDRNIQKIENLLDGVKADLIVLPELSNSGYLYKSPQELEPFSEDRHGNGRFLDSLIKKAKQTNGIIITGYAEKVDDKLFNSAIALSSEGPLANYRKIHLFDREKSLFQPGNSGFSILNWKGINIGMMICFDWIFPEACRSLALAGAQIIAHPANLVLPYCQNAMITRSLENRVFTITANRIGKEKFGNSELSFTGVSQITDPSGEIRYRGPENKETVHVMQIDPEEALNKKINSRNDLFQDRKPVQYQILTES